MPDEKETQPIGGPEPISNKDYRKLIRRLGAGITIAAGGIFTFVFLIAPTRLSGATRSMKLKWQQREQEIQKAIQSTTSEGRNLPAKPESPPATETSEHAK